MKWILVLALSLLVVTFCVVYLRHERRPLVRPPALVELNKKAVPKSLPVSRKNPPKPGSEGPVDISGPLKDRDLLSWVIPEYPEWAQEKGIAGVLRIKIWVTPAGVVKSFMEAQQMTPDPRLDEKAKEAIQAWRFEEKPNAFGDQWGVVTVHYALLAQESSTPEAMLHGVSLGGSTASGAWKCVKEWMGSGYRYYCRLVRPKVE